MAVTSDISTSFTALTGSGTQDTVHTGAGTECITVTFHNYGASSATLKIFVNGTAAKDVAFGGSSGVTLEVGDTAGLEEVKMGSGDVIYAEASAAATIAYMVEQDALS